MAPPYNFHKQLFSSHKMFDKKRLITTRHRGKHFCSRSFWASNFFCKQGNLQNWCWQQDVLNEAMNSASFLEFIFFFCYSIWVFCVAQPLWPWLKPSAAQVLSKIVYFNQTMTNLTIDYSWLGFRKFFIIFLFLSGRDASWPNIFFKVDEFLSLVVRE